MRFESEELLVAALTAGPCVGQGWLLGVDGDQRAGKSALSQRLAERLDAHLVSCDAFIKDGKRQYPDALDLQSLSDQLSGAAADRTPVIIEGVMLQLILTALNVRPAAMIYVQHCWPAGNYTRPELFDTEALNAAYAYEIELSRCFHKSEVGLDGEILRYHLSHQPHTASTYLFEHVFKLGS